MKLVIEKAKRCLTLLDNGTAVLTCAVALGRSPAGAKTREGDGKTPEGTYRICLVKEKGKYGLSLGLDYPNAKDAEAGLKAGLIDQGAYEAILKAQAAGIRPPWGTALGGEIYLHEGGIAADWTQGCVALEAADMAVVFAYRQAIESVTLLP